MAIKLDEISALIKDRIKHYAEEFKKLMILVVLFQLEMVFV